LTQIYDKVFRKQTKNPKKCIFLLKKSAKPLFLNGETDIFSNFAPTLANMADNA